ncbi:MAG: hypothetical protein SGCHY_005006 [Lobulomycetales sp.]
MELDTLNSNGQPVSNSALPATVNSTPEIPSADMGELPPMYGEDRYSTTDLPGYQPPAPKPEPPAVQLETGNTPLFRGVVLGVIPLITLFAVLVVRGLPYRSKLLMYSGTVTTQAFVATIGYIGLWRGSQVDCTDPDVSRFGIAGSCVGPIITLVYGLAAGVSFLALVGLTQKEERATVAPTTS